MKLKRFLYLPDGKVFNVYDENAGEWTKEKIEQDIVNTRLAMAKLETSSIKVVDETGGVITLILGNGVLKNSYFTYQEIAGV